MTVSISRMEIAYYLSSIAVGDTSAPKGQLTGYYTASGDPEGRWFGNGLSGIGMVSEQVVTKQAAISLYEEAKHPGTGITLGKRPIKETAAPKDAKTASGKTAKPTRKPVSGFDLTFSAPKSVSVLWAIGDNFTQARIHQAHQEAVRKTLTWAEENIIQTRAGNGGVVRVKTEGIIASLFDHYDSRAGDPQLHTHAVLANRIQRASDGAWVTLDSYSLYKATVTISEMYNSILFDELAQRVSAEAEQRDPLVKALRPEEETNHNDRMELAGVPDSLIAEFSQRTISIEQRKDELVAAWEKTHDKKAPDTLVLEFRRQATLETREEKDAHKKPLYQRMAEWRIRTIQNNLSPQKIIQEATGRDITYYKPELFTQQAKEEIATQILYRTIDKHPTFNRNNLLASAHRLTASIRFQSVNDRDKFAQELTDLALTEAVELTPDRYNLDHLTQSGLSLRGSSVFDRKEEKKYTTAEVLHREAQLMHGVTTATGSHVTDAEKAREDLSSFTSADGYHLAPDQLEAAHQVITSDKAISAIIGPAGTGKTSTLAGLRSAWEAQNGQGTIIGLAPSAAAAAVLGKELGISTDNTAKWLYESIGQGSLIRAERYQKLKKRISTLESQNHNNPASRRIQARLDAARTQLTTLISEQAKYQIKPGQLLIVDESSMASTEDLYKLYQQTQAVGAKMLLVGDPKQLDAVDAGGFLGWVENKGYSANLTSVWRFKEDWEKKASLNLRNGNTEVLDEYMKHGRIFTSEDALAAAYEGWKEDTTAGKSSVLIAGRNDQVLDLNMRAQGDLIDQGRVDATQGITIRTGQAYLGDKILTRLNNRQIIDSEGDFIKNGTRLTITEIHKDAITAQREDTGAIVTIPAAYAVTSIELGYACTIHRAQGLTVDTNHLALDTSYNREQFYVGMTRGKQSNLAYITLPEEAEQDKPDTWGIMRAIEAETAKEYLTGILSKSDVDKTAHETGEIEYGWANDLGRAVAELDYLSDLSATRRTHHWVQTHLGYDPRQVADSAEMKTLILAAKEATIDFSQLPENVTTLEQATLYLKKHRDNTAHELVPAARFTNVQEEEAQTAILAKINARVDEIKTSNATEPWLQDLRRDFPLEEDSHREVIIWRALSHQKDADTYLGQEPDDHEKRLSRYYQRLQQVLKTHEKDNMDNYMWDSSQPAVAPMPEAPGLIIDDFSDVLDYQPLDTPDFSPAPRQADSPDLF